jgi:hypothetical protein
MGEVPLYAETSHGREAARGHTKSQRERREDLFLLDKTLQGYLAHKKPPPPRSLQQPCA